MQKIKVKTFSVLVKVRIVCRPYFLANNKRYQSVHFSPVSEINVKGIKRDFKTKLDFLNSI